MWTLQSRTFTSQYLEVNLNAGSNYLADHERDKKTATLRGKGVLARRTRWTLNRYEVIRGLWKMVIVLGVTFANGVLVLSTPAREFLERRKKDGLGGHEGGAELKRERPHPIGELRFAGKQMGTPRYIVYREKGTRWIHHVKRLRQRYEFSANWLEGVGKCRVRPAEIRKTIRAAETRRWTTRMGGKPHREGH